MHGLILVTWENFLVERFGASLRNAYRTALEENPNAAPLVSKVYQDEKLLKSINIASKLSGMSANILLREYGHYFITNRLTNHICVYLLSQVKNGRELLLTMREAHVHMRHTPDGLSLPIFTYEQLPGHANNFALIYDSPRQLCPILYGAIEGAMERFGEKVSIREKYCMKTGARPKQEQFNRTRTLLFKKAFLAPASPYLHLRWKQWAEAIAPRRCFLYQGRS